MSGKGWFVFVQSATSSTQERDALYVVLCTMTGLALFLAFVAVIYLVYTFWSLLVTNKCGCSNRNPNNNSNYLNMEAAVRPADFQRPPPMYQDLTEAEDPPTYETAVIVQLGPNVRR
jgi:hypothetical protein